MQTILTQTFLLILSGLLVGCGGGNTSDPSKDNTVATVATVAKPEASNQPPVFKSLAHFEVVEGDYGLWKIRVSDADDDLISLQLSGGADQASFSLTDDGHLQFVQKAQFHQPSDQTRDNIYHVEINASDGIDRVSQDIEISVIQSVQAPEITTLVAGFFRVADTITIDSDTNDPTRLLVRNNQFDQAQITTNPSTILGYMNTRHQGPEGSLFATGDTRDVYQVSALGGEIINLTINAAEKADLDLYVYDMNGQIVSSSVGGDASESVTLPESVADYYVLVKFYGFGASNYSLTVGIDDHQAAGEWVTAVDQNDIEARLVEPDNLDATSSRDGFLQEDVEDEVLSDKAKFGVDHDRFDDQWHMSIINVQAAWKINTGSSDVTVAVIDTGVFSQHPELRARLSPDSYDFISDPLRSGDGDGYDTDANDPGNGRDNALCPNSPNATSSFHGTHIAGIIAAESNNLTGTSGIVQNGTIMNLRALGCQGGNAFDIANAVLYAAGLENDAGVLPTKKADIINLSISGTGNSETLKSAIAAARAEGIIVVAAAGNLDSDKIFYPAAYDGVIGVSATDGQDMPADFSNYGGTVDLAAPGGRERSSDSETSAIISTQAALAEGGIIADFGELMGTSMASAQVAGVLGLMKAVYPQLTPELVERLLSAGHMTVDLGPKGRDDVFGHGRIDSYKAVEFVNQLAAGMPFPDQPVVALSTTYLNFSSLRESALLSVNNAGNGTLKVSAVTGESNYVQVDEIRADESYLIRLNRTGLANGLYQNRIHITTNAGRFSVPLVFSVVESVSLRFSDIGAIKMKLKTSSSVWEEQSAAAGQDNHYAYAFEADDAPSELLAGVDLDNDGEVCAPRERCVTLFVGNALGKNVGSTENIVDVTYMPLMQ